MKNTARECLHMVQMFFLAIIGKLYFYQAKRIREMLPPLPEGVMPSYIQYLDAIQKLEKKDIHVKVSDISDVMNLPRPGVTRTVKEMEKKGYLSTIAKFYQIMCERRSHYDK